MTRHGKHAGAPVTAGRPVRRSRKHRHRAYAISLAVLAGGVGAVAVPTGGLAETIRAPWTEGHLTASKQDVAALVTEATAQREKIANLTPGLARQGGIGSVMTHRAQQALTAVPTNGAAPSHGPVPRPTSAAPTVTQQPSGAGITPFQDLAGATFSARVNGGPSSGLVSLPAQLFELTDFAAGQASSALGAFDYGAQVAGRGLIGSGPDQTVIQLKPGSSTRAATVASGDGSGGSSQPTNDLYVLDVEGPGATLSDLTVRGTDQGHPYNGIHMDQASNPVLNNVSVESIPGTSSANPGETFAIDLHRATGTATIRNLTITGGTGSLASAAGLGPNSCSAALDINGFTATGLTYSAPIALWEQTGPVTIRGMVSHHNPRSLGAERLAAPVSIYDPVWDAPSSGHDITYTPWAGHPAGSISFYFSDASKLPGRKIVILTDDPSVKPTVHVFVAGVEQPQANYIAWQGA